MSGEFLNFSLSTWLVFAFVTLILWLSIRRPRDYPPGPRLVFPVIGHLYLLRKDTLKLFQQLRAELGDIFHLRMGSKLTVVLNGYGVLKEAFVKNADVFSDRPQMFYNDHISGYKGIIDASGPMWKEGRKLAVGALSQYGFKRILTQEKILEEVRIFISAIERQQGQAFEIKNFIYVAITNMICSFVFGKRFDYDDSSIRNYIAGIEDGFKLAPRIDFLDYFPFLRYLPGDLFGYKKVKKHRRKISNNFLKPTVIQHFENFDKNNISDFISAYIKEMKEKERAGATTNLDMENLLKTIEDFFIAGTETTATTLMWAIVYFLNFPEIQQKCFKEINENIDSEEFPTLDDKARLLFLNAFILEVLRHANIVPVALPHGLSRDVILCGYRIPKNAVVIPNLDSILRDPTIWENPEMFCPERFLQDGKVVKMEEFVPFSIGRRTCPGERLAMTELFLFLAAMVQHFQFVCEDGQPPPKLQRNLGITHLPNHFKVRALLRN